jgi:hypothetical protein
VGDGELWLSPAERTERGMRAMAPAASAAHDHRGADGLSATRLDHPPTLHRARTPCRPADPRFDSRHRSNDQSCIDLLAHNVAGTRPAPNALNARGPFNRK